MAQSHVAVRLNGMIGVTLVDSKVVADASEHHQPTLRVAQLFGATDQIRAALAGRTVRITGFSGEHQPNLGKCFPDSVPLYEVSLC